MKGLRSFFTAYGLSAGLVALALVSGCDGSPASPPSFDPVELALVRVEPGDGSSDVARNRVVRMFFNTNVLPSSVHDQSLILRTGGTFQTRPEGTFLISGNVVEFDPTVTTAGASNAIGFPAGAQVLVEIPLKEAGDGIPANNFLQNVEGNPITVASGDNVVAFTTGSGWDDPVPGPPGVLGLEFTPGANNVGQVPSNAAVTVIFSEPIDPGSIVLGKNLFLTNNTDTSPLFQQDIPSITFFDGSLTRYTFLPVFGFGQGPFNILVNFIDPDAPDTFSPDRLPRDLGGNRVQNFTFFQTFDTQFDPSTVNTGLVRETFTTFTQRDSSGTDAIWGDDANFPFALVSPEITTRTADIGIVAMVNLGGMSTVIDNPQTTPPSPPLTPTGRQLGEEDYCPTANPLVGPDLPVNVGNPPTSKGRRQLNLYRAAELGPNGTIIRIAWGPDSDATFAATYPDVIMRVGHKKGGTSLANAALSANFDVDGSVLVAGPVSYTVPQRANHGDPSLLNEAFVDWPAMDAFFDYNGSDDILVDVEAKEGNTFQTFRTFLSLNSIGVCSCTTFFGCALNTVGGLRQADTTYGSDILDPPGNFVAGVANPGPFAHAMQFELAKLRSDALSLYYDTGVVDPDYLSPIINPLVQQGGATITLTWAGSADGIVDDVTFTPNIDDIDGFRYFRWAAILRANLFTGGRARIELMEIPFTFE